MNELRGLKPNTTDIPQNYWVKEVGNARPGNDVCRRLGISRHFEKRPRIIGLYYGIDALLKFDQTQT